MAGPAIGLLAVSSEDVVVAFERVMEMRVSLSVSVGARVIGRDRRPSNEGGQAASSQEQRNGQHDGDNDTRATG